MSLTASVASMPTFLPTPSYLMNPTSCSFCAKFVVEPATELHFCGGNRAESTRRHRRRGNPPFARAPHTNELPWDRGPVYYMLWEERKSRSTRGRGRRRTFPTVVESGGSFRNGGGCPAAAGDVILDDPFEELEARQTRYTCVVHNALAAPAPYVEGWEWQKQALERRTTHPDDLSDPDVVLVTQHNPVFTLGTGSTLDNLKFEPENAPFDVVRTERGGEVTYHGPGQIVLYPIMNLRKYRRDIHWYLRALEETVIRTLSKLGLRAERVKGLTGVWVDGRKVAAVGVRVKRWITMHGLSLNVRPDLTHFKHIVPCGIEDRPVGSLEELCVEGEDCSLERISVLLLESFEEVFGVLAVGVDDWQDTQN